MRKQHTTSLPSNSDQRSCPHCICSLHSTQGNCQRHHASISTAPTILPPRDLSLTHFPPWSPPRPHDRTHADNALPKMSHTKAAAAARRASQPKDPFAALTPEGVAAGLGLADTLICIYNSNKDSVTVLPSWLGKGALSNIPWQLSHWKTLQLGWASHTHPCAPATATNAVSQVLFWYCD